MKLVGRDFSPKELVQELERRVAKLTKSPASASVIELGGPEPFVNPFAFYTQGLAEHADVTLPLPVQTHRAGVGGLVVVAKKVYRKVARPFINETLGRQRVFNDHVRDGFALLSAEVVQLRAEVAALRATGKRTDSPPVRRGKAPKSK